MTSADTGSSGATEREGRNILVVEDEALILMSVIDMVEELGYRAIGASNAAAALAEIEGGTDFHAMITDVSLPDMPGQDLARVARQHRDALPVVFSTGHRLEISADLAASGPTTVLGKPYWTDQLAEAIAKVSSETCRLP